MTAAVPTIRLECPTCGLSRLVHRSKYNPVSSQKVCTHCKRQAAAVPRAARTAATPIGSTHVLVTCPSCHQVRRIGRSKKVTDGAQLRCRRCAARESGPSRAQAIRAVRATQRPATEQELRALKPPPVPTVAPPGSPEKILIMSERLSAGFALHHPDDARGWDSQ